VLFMEGQALFGRNPVSSLTGGEGKMGEELEETEGYLSVGFGGVGDG
jgi:hypothetical protein